MRTTPDPRVYDPHPHAREINSIYPVVDHRKENDRVRRSLPIALLLFTVAPAYATSVTVPDDFATLQAAFNSLNSQPADTVFVKPGVVSGPIETHNLGNHIVIGLGDSLSRPSVASMLFDQDATFVNLRFSGSVQTATQGNSIFRDCRFEAGFTTLINGGPRNVTMVGCRISGTVLAVSDAFVNVDSCWFDQGTIVNQEDSRLTVRNSAFRGPASYGVRAVGGFDPETVVQGCTFRDLGTAIYGDGSFAITNNVIEMCSVGVSLQEDGSLFGNQVRRCGIGIDVTNPRQVVGNIVTDCTGDGIRLRVIETDGNCERNIVARSGRNGLFIERRVGSTYGAVAVRNNTSYDNAWSGFVRDLDSNPDAVSRAAHGGVPDVVTHNIGYRNGGHGLLSLGAEFTLSCNDWFGNDSSAVEGIGASADDLALDPLLCDVDLDSVSLAADSPLLNAPGCGLIGARGVGCAATPTLVTMFTAQREANGVRVSWRLADPARLYEVRVERADVIAGPWAVVAAERTTEGDVIIALDRNAQPEHRYWYRLVVGAGSEFVISEPVSVSGSMAARFELTRVAPNPGFGPMSISFTLAREASVAVDVLDLQGRLVTSLVGGSRAAGTHTVEWSGRSVSPGIYLVDYRFPGGHQVERVIRLR